VELEHQVCLSEQEHEAALLFDADARMSPVVALGAGAEGLRV